MPARPAGVLPTSLVRALPYVGGTLDYLRDPTAFMAHHLERHGPVSEMPFLGRRWTVLIGPDACSTALRNADKAFANRPGWGELVGPFFDGGLMLLDFEEHHRHRRLMQQAFTRDRVEGYAAALSPAIQQLLGDWPTHGPVDAYPALKSLTLDLATQVFMGGADLTRAEQDRINRAFVDCVQAATAFVRLSVRGRAGAVRSRDAGCSSRSCGSACRGTARATVTTSSRRCATSSTATTAWATRTS
ncbi:MAG: cytochrome P450 [Aeromicrobium erythreum]